ncbi:hydrolase, TatD family [Thermodesulfobium narugense DSM 14796]|uniref:Hydrolase, TatD family n=1 Tax=Thermodesulfobium narugense DSM 14796 TaxID=747365 RepID=M1E692_9BACT|nr:TatD family hydrolase [Thermodesulfobium narugense]AEE13870.1 hydrolase, TatD family [Thermodesulfobium narugense DSM 14796]
MFFDSHLHLESESFDSDREDVIKRAFDEQVGLMINVGSDLETSLKSIELSNKYVGKIFAVVGFHPHEAKFFNENSYNAIKGLTCFENVLAIGEIGLDYHYNYSPREVQIDCFRKQLELAREVGLPVVIHMREATKDTIDILEEFDADSIGGVFHCFSGSVDTMKKVVSMNFFVSFAGPITFSNSHRLRNVVLETPIERILSETDSPFLAPVPFRGKRNEPVNVKEVVKAISEIKKIDIDNLKAILFENLLNAFPKLKLFKNKGLVG